MDAGEGIERALCTIEKQFGVIIIFAAEGGSRCWGWDTKDSDHDIRFVYVHRLNWYLTIDQSRRDVIDYECELMEFHGWDIKKTMKMIRECNPGALEWLRACFARTWARLIFKCRSGMVYRSYSNFLSRSLFMANKYHAKKSIVMHYLNIAKKHKRDYLDNRETIVLKKYFYVLQPLLCVEYIKQHEKDTELPPVNIHALLENLHFPEEENLNTLTQLLKQRKEDPGSKIVILDEWISTLFQSGQEFSGVLPVQQFPPIEEYDAILYDTVMDVQSQMTHLDVNK